MPTIRPALAADLDAANAVIEACVMAWELPPRVKRLALGSYLYRTHDLEYMDMLVAETAPGEIVGIAALEAASPADLPDGRSGLLLHGLYVLPARQHEGIGGRLVDAALALTRTRTLDGLLVKAQSEAVGFFRAMGFIKLAVEDPATDYANRWWQPA